ncbi:hypothetical protein BH10PLA2_BH10PLA2_11410 [soil metagenome]
MVCQGRRVGAVLAAIKLECLGRKWETNMIKDIGGMGALFRAIQRHAEPGVEADRGNG